jgi:DNA polymerase-1
MTDLVLIDGSSYLYRAFHALPALTNAQGEPTGALHGVLTMILKLLREEQPAHIAVVFDAPGKTFRDEMYAEYKATRPPMPDDLRSQVQPILDAVEAMGLPLLQVKGVEADDVIGTLCVRAEDEGLQVLVSTGDKDLAQLVTDKVTLVNTMNDSRLDRDAVKAKFDVYPEQIIDYLALVGDSSDNIPGVPKVGAKTAAKWLNLYDSADGIVEHGDEIKGKVGESLRDNIESLRLSQDLATIKTDVGLDVGIDDLKASEADTDALRKLYSHFDLRSLLRGLDEGAAEEPQRSNDQEATEYEMVLTWKAFDAWLRKLDKAKLAAFDTETNSLDYMNAEIVGFSLSTTVGEACYVPVAHDHSGPLQHCSARHGLRFDA